MTRMPRLPNKESAAWRVAGRWNVEMGFSISWVAFKGVGKPEVLRRTGLEPTGKIIDIPNDSAPFAFVALPTGWSAVASGDFRYGSREGLGHLSEGNVTVLGCQIEEHIMYSAAALSIGGREVWSITHRPNKATYELETSGTLPPQFETIRIDLFAKQRKDKPDPFETDYVFDVPIELAFALTGYRHDRWKLAWGEPRYEQLEAAGATGKKR